jgi:hypothetical protein
LRFPWALHLSAHPPTGCCRKSRFYSSERTSPPMVACSQNRALDMLHVPYGDEYGGASGVRLRRTQSSRARRSSVL